MSRACANLTWRLGLQALLVARNNAKIYTLVVKWFYTLHRYHFAMGSVITYQG